MRGAGSGVGRGRGDIFECCNYVRCGVERWVGQWYEDTVIMKIRGISLSFEDEKLEIELHVHKIDVEVGACL